MGASRYVLYHRGGSSTEERARDVERVRAEPRLRVLEEDGRVLLVEAPAEAAEALEAALPAWTVAPEVRYEAGGSTPPPSDASPRRPRDHDP